MPAQALHLNLNLILTPNLTFSLTLSCHHVSAGQSPPARSGTSPDHNPEPTGVPGRSGAGEDGRRPRLAELQHPRAGSGAGGAPAPHIRAAAAGGDTRAGAAD